MHLLDFLFPPRADERTIRDVSVDAFLVRLAPGIVTATQPETVALLPFSDPVVRAAIHEAKYHASEHARLLLGSALAEYVRDANEEIKKGIIVPVPLGKVRYKERGYNQVEEIARCALREIDTPFEIQQILVRTRETVSQVSLAREARAANMRGAFGAALPISPVHTYVLLDDVITTGATLQAGIDALREAGATHILPIALAH